MVDRWFDSRSPFLSAFSEEPQTASFALLTGSELIGRPATASVQQFSALSDLDVEVPYVQQLLTGAAVGRLSTGRVGNYVVLIRCRG